MQLLPPCTSFSMTSPLPSAIWLLLITAGEPQALTLACKGRESPEKVEEWNSQLSPSSRAGSLILWLGFLVRLVKAGEAVAPHLTFSYIFPSNMPPDMARICPCRQGSFCRHLHRPRFLFWTHAAQALREPSVNFTSVDVPVEENWLL